MSNQPETIKSMEDPTRSNMIDIIDKFSKKQVAPAPPYVDDICSICKTKASGGCRCKDWGDGISNDRTCINGHTWYWNNGKRILGSHHDISVTASKNKVIVAQNSSVPEWISTEVKATWKAMQGKGQLESYRIMERMVKRLGYGDFRDPSLAISDKGTSSTASKKLRIKIAKSQWDKMGKKS